jgi:multicomponent Na+:H+ antiporter subunit F
MTGLWLAAVAVLLVCGPLCGLYIAARGTALARLVGLQLAGVTTVMILVAMSLADAQTSYLIVPLALAILLVTGTLVFTRLLRQHGQRLADAHARADEGEAH